MHIKYVKRDGTDGVVESFRPRSPQIKRRGAALHPVYAAVQKHALSDGETIKHVYRARGAQP